MHRDSLITDALFPQETKLKIDSFLSVKDGIFICFCSWEPNRPTIHMAVAHEKYERKGILGFFDRYLSKGNSVTTDTTAKCPNAEIHWAG